VRALVLALTIACAALVIAGCGEKKETAGAPVTFGPGVTETPPPWKPEYAHLQERMKMLGVPPPGNEKFHHHAQLHIYNDGLLIPVSTHIGLGKTSAGLHTHDATGVIHIESTKPFKATLGDFFTIWGVPFGTEQVGNLHASGKNKVFTYVNGKPVADPIHYVMKDGDNIVVAYGTAGSFPKTPDTTALKREQQGLGVCGKNQKKGGKTKSCVSN
jgi:hypothetical protein